MSMNEPLRGDALAVDYRYTNSAPTWANAYLWPALNRIITGHHFAEKKAFEIGCGNGATANWLHELGFTVTGVGYLQRAVLPLPATLFRV